MVERKEAGGTDGNQTRSGADRPAAIAEVEVVPSAGAASAARVATPSEPASSTSDGARTARDQIRGGIAETVDSVAEAARRARETMRGAIDNDEIRDIADHARGVAGQIVDDVRGAAAQLLEDQKMRAAETVRGFAGALHRTAESLGGENAQAAQIADRLAERVDTASTRLRDRHWSQLVADTEDFAHRRPALFMAGAVAIGFVLGRMLAPSTTYGARIHAGRGAD